MMISMIVAIGNDRQLGKDNQLLWHISEDLKNFKRITMDKPIVMGRKTYDSIGRPLPKRTNIILTRDHSYKQDGCLVFHSKEEILSWASENNLDELVIIGGSEIYKLFLGDTHKLFLSQVDYDGPADVYFPKIDQGSWKLINEETHMKNEKAPAWVFKELDRI